MLEFDHGVCLTGEEYDQQIVELYSGQDPVPTKEQDAYNRKQELELAIDYRLGVDFPRDRRESLWKIQERVENRRKWLILLHIVKFTFGADLLADYLVKEYAKELAESEMLKFFGEEL